MASRNLLHKNKLKDFKTWLQRRGWVEEFTKGPYEVLRMEHPMGNAPLIVYTKQNAKEHLSIHDIAYKLCCVWLKELSDEKKAKKELEE
jgi:hypothetical protein